MADAVLTLKMNPKTGERTLVINYESEPDALSFEHEDDHRTFVEQLLGQPLNTVADRLEVQRTPPHPLIINDLKVVSTSDETSELQAEPQES